MRRVGHWMLQALKDPENARLHETIRQEVRAMCGEFPVPAAVLDESAV
jgi:glycine hydroxymethyltransferase